MFDEARPMFVQFLISAAGRTGILQVETQLSGALWEIRADRTRMVAHSQTPESVFYFVFFSFGRRPQCAANIKTPCSKNRWRTGLHFAWLNATAAQLFVSHFRLCRAIIRTPLQLQSAGVLPTRLQQNSIISDCRLHEIEGSHFGLFTCSRALISGSECFIFHEGRWIYLKCWKACLPWRRRLWTCYQYWTEKRWGKKKRKKSSCRDETQIKVEMFWCFKVSRQVWNLWNYWTEIEVSFDH